MIQVIKIILLILGSVILQNSLIANLSIFGSKPNLSLALTVSISLLKGSFHGEIVGFFSGLLLDLSSGSPFLGIHSFSQTLVGYFIGLMRLRFYSESLVTQAISGFSACLADKLISALILGILLSNLSFPKIRLEGLLLTSLINSLLVAIIFQLVAKALKDKQVP